MNAKMIDALKGIHSNLGVFITEMENMNKTSHDTTEDEVVPKAEAPATKPVTKETAPAKTTRKEREASETIPDVSNGLTEEQLNALSYNGLKRLASEMGIPAKGSRADLTEKILAYEGEVSNPDAEDETVEEEETPAPKSTRSRKIQKTQPVEEEFDDEDEGDEDPIVAKVNEAVAEMTNEEIADLLADVGVKVKGGKRQALIDAVIKAVNEGKIDLDDEDSDEEESDEETADESEEYDVNDPENPDMTEERKSAIEAFKSETENDFSEGTITRPQIIDWLNEFHGTKDKMKKKSDDELVEEYIYCVSLLINDEGEMTEEEGAYTVNGIPYCCGHELAFNEDTNTYICENCGGEYEADEE